MKRLLIELEGLKKGETVEDKVKRVTKKMDCTRRKIHTSLRKNEEETQRRLGQRQEKTEMKATKKRLYLELLENGWIKDGRSRLRIGERRVRFGLTHIYWERLDDILWRVYGRESYSGLTLDRILSWGDHAIKERRFKQRADILEERKRVRQWLLGSGWIPDTRSWLHRDGIRLRFGHSHLYCETQNSRDGLWAVRAKWLYHELTKNKLLRRMELKNYSMETDWQREAHHYRIRKMEKKRKKKKPDKKERIRQWLLNRNWSQDSLGRLHKNGARVRFSRECLYWEYRDFYDERWEIWGVGVYGDLRLGVSLSGLRIV